ncbi:MAG: hypothetical protein LBM98_08765 [Oscillospiraceae bacterium]|nr:hypothetical protein [Oscillospiraceae bacterium]
MRRSFATSRSVASSVAGNSAHLLRISEAPTPVIAKHRYARDTYNITGAKQSSAGSVTYDLRIAGYYVNPGLLRRITFLRIASAVAASQRRCAEGRTTGRATPCPHSGAPRRSGLPAPCAGRAGLKPAPT